MNTFFRFKSLRTRLAFWFLLVTMLCLVAVVATLYFQRSEIIRGREFEKLEIVRDLKARELNNWLEERMGDLQVLANDNDIRGLEGISIKKKDDWTPEDLKAAFLGKGMTQRFFGAYSAYHEVFYVEATSGRVFISTELTREGDDKRKSPYFIEPKRTRKPFIQDVYDSKTEGKPEMALSAPVFCSLHDGEHLIGVLVMRVNLEQNLYPLLQNRTGTGETGETLIVNKDGFAINALRWHESAPLKLKINAEPAVRAVGGETGIVESEDYRGEMVLAAYTHIPLMGWGFVVKRDLAEVYAPIDAMLRDIVALVLASLLVVLFVSFFLSGTIAGPVVGIGAIVRRFTEGDLDARCPTTGVDEVATLGMLFNEMAATLSSQMTIQQHTSEVADTMVAADDMEKFASGLLMKLIDISGSHLGAFYLRSEDGQTLEQVASVGLSDDVAQSFSAEDREGELGQALATGKIACLRDISPDTAFTFKTTGGTAVPREIMTIPLLIERRVMAVVSLATLSAYSDTHREIIDRSQIGMNTALSNLMWNQKTQALANELSGRNTELGAQTEELQAMNEEFQQQAEELQEQNVELETQRQQVEEANRLKSEFLSNMSHELRTPLNSVMALSRVLIMQAKEKLSQEEAHYLEIIERNGKQLLNLINDILDLSKIEAGRMDVNPRLFSPKSTIETILESLETLAEDKGVEVIQKIPDDLPKIESDESRVHQILQNIIGNAVKFTNQGSVTVSASHDAQKIYIRIKDTGIGISEKDRRHIFDEFRQADGSSARLFEGTGLGLTIAYKAAKMLGGNISVDSAVGQGSTFTMTLPIKWEGLAQVYAPGAVKLLAQITPEHPQARDFAKDARILLVEDNEAVHIQVKAVLESENYIVDVAENGQKAIEYVKHTIPDGIILDLMMPEVDGFEVLEKIRSTAATAGIPVLVLTAKDLTPDDLNKLSANNIQQLIHKGDVDRQSLLFKIRLMLGSQQGLKPQEKILQPAVKIKPLPKTSIAGTATVLVIEDNPDNLITIKAVLQSRYNILEASDGEEGLKKTLSEKPDLVLLDMSLPKLDGFTVVKKIKEDQNAQHIPVIALTARAMKGDREKILEAGCDDYISKPIDPGKILEKVDKWLGG